MNKTTVRKFSIGNGDASLVSFDYKQKIIDHLYKNVDLSKYRYNMLNNIQRLKYLQDNEHFVSPNYKGYNYFLIMLTLDNKNFCVLIDKKKLSYHKNQLDMKTLQVIQIFMKASNDFFTGDGSIMYGKLSQQNNSYVFIIQDCYYLQGKSLLNLVMDKKMEHLDTIIKTHFNKKGDNSYCNNFELKLNKIYSYAELEDLILNILPKSTVENHGIIFYPKISGITTIFLDQKANDIINNNNKIEFNSNNNNEKLEQKSYHIIHNFVDFLKSRTYSYEINKNNNKQFWLSKTSIADVYDISNEETSDKLGIALIPNLKISHLCENNINERPVRFNCTYSNKYKKWIPIEIV